MSVPWDPGCLHEKEVRMGVVWGAAATTSRLLGERKLGQVALEEGPLPAFSVLQLWIGEWHQVSGRGLLLQVSALLLLGEI